MGRSQGTMKLVACVAFACLFLHQTEGVSSSDDSTDLGDLYNADLLDSPTRGDCASVTRSMPALCKVLGESSCATLRSKLDAKCGAEGSFLELEEEQPPKQEHEVDDLSSRDLGASVARRGRRGRRSVMTSGSFVMRSNRAGNDELDEDDDLGESSDDAWDLTNNGRCEFAEGLGSDRC